MKSVLDNLRGNLYGVGQMMLEGDSFEQISESLGYKIKTIRNYASQIYANNGYKDRIDFMAREIKNLRNEVLSLKNQLNDK